MLLSFSLKLPGAVHRRNYLCKLPLFPPPRTSTVSSSHRWYCDKWEKPEKIHQRRSMLTVVNRKLKNEPMGVGTHGSCTVIELNLQGRKTHGSKTELAGLSKLCWTLRARIETHRSEPLKQIIVIVCFKYFLLSLVNVQALIIRLKKKRLLKTLSQSQTPMCNWLGRIHIL